MNISIFIEQKTKPIICHECLDGYLEHQIGSINSEIERSKEEIIYKNKEEIQKIIGKMNSGDDRTIRDICGDRPNPYKVEK